MFCINNAILLIILNIVMLYTIIRIRLNSLSKDVINKNFSPNYKSQFNQDIVLYYKYFYNISDGFFFEIGAYDGITISNTYLFEKNLNWKGILVEGGSRNCKKLIANSYKRSKSTIICSPICLSQYIYYNEADVTGSIIKYGNNKKRIRCNTLKNITSSLNIKHIDLFSLDVEGSELEVLQTFDFNVTVSYWLIEWAHLSDLTKNNIINLMNRNSYKRNKDFISNIDVLFSHI